MDNNFEVGDRIVNNYPNELGNINHGKTGHVYRRAGFHVFVQYDDGTTGVCQNGGYGYRNLSKCGSVATINNKITIMQKLSNFITKTVDGDTQALLKAGYINGNLAPTQKAFDKIAEINFFANKAALVEAAKEDIAEAARCEKSNG